jgi:hypothetical protein
MPITLHLQDGQLGDDTTEDGKIVDQGGLGQLKPSVPVPTMNELGMVFFILLAGLGAAYFMQRSRRKINV